jgi:hypothetical protein
MVRRAAATALLHQPFAREQIARRAGGRPHDVRMPRCQPLQEFLRPPVRMSATGRDQQIRDGLGDLVRTVMRRPTPVVQGRTAAGVVPGEPLIARLPTHRVARAELRHLVQPEAVIINKAFAFFHGYRLQPGH